VKNGLQCCLADLLDGVLPPLLEYTGHETTQKGLAMRSCRPCSQEEERLTSRLHRMTEDCFYSWLGTSAAEPFGVFLLLGRRKASAMFSPEAAIGGAGWSLSIHACDPALPVVTNPPSGGVGLEAFRNSVLFF
jgi:hypothetical protein